MSAAFLFFLLFFALNNNAVSVSAQQRRSTTVTISPGSSLTPTGNSTWLSPSALYAFGFFPVNSTSSSSYVVGIFLAGIPDKTVVWTANMGTPSVAGDATLRLTRDGRFVLQQRGRQDVQIANPPMSIASASMLDNGNFVLYGSNSTVVWQSFDYPTNTLLPGQRLARPQPEELFSSASETDYSRGLFRIKMQSDGNLVHYPVGSVDSATYAYYASGTYLGGSNCSLNLESNGNLYLFNGSSIILNLTNGFPAEENTALLYLFRIDVDGIARLYSHSLNQKGGNWTVRWATTTDRCAPKGICGFNSFCFLQDMVPDCKCLPGFDRIQSDNRTAGCARVSAVSGCGNKRSEEKLEMREEESTVWEDNTYQSSDGMSREECTSSCLNDCNCDVAFYKDGRCAKQRLPLRFGRRSTVDSNVALVKVRFGEYTSSDSPTGVGVSRKELPRDILFIGIALIVISALFMVISIVYIRRKHGAYKKLTHDGDARLDDDVSLRVFTYADVARATNDFGERIGKGASGTVFKGSLQSRSVAVKKLEKECGTGTEFQTEIRTIGKTYHRNLVRLLGYCSDGPYKLLVFEYMSNGSLADLLFDPEKQPTWEARINIARDIARGILYLHEECETQIIHCDIKSQNILLDEHGCAKISDFGLAKLLKQDQTNTYTGIRGTKGYVAPEWHSNQAITVKADVYSYGIVLLEIICRRKSINWNLSEDEAVLEEWVYERYDAKEVQDLVGDEMVDKRKLERVVKIGLWCIQNEPSLRPSMKKVLLMLEGTVDIPIPPNPMSFLSSAV